ncbi:MAG TPA: hypothetical protein VM532_10345, partial [Burkholderiales bacterium]|nr:hypothetical protein [Burkholderiales bacterium]
PAHGSVGQRQWMFHYFLVIYMRFEPTGEASHFFQQRRSYCRSELPTKRDGKLGQVYYSFD